MNAIRLLKQDHRNVKALFRKVERAEGAEKQKLGQQIIAELSVHADVEEKLLYPALRARDPKHEDDILEALEEHHAAKLLLLELDKMTADHERYQAKMTVLRESIEHHIDEEEDELFPRLERLFPSEILEAMGQEMLALKDSAPDHPHPAAPDTPPGNVVGDVLARILDAGKDLMRRVTSPSKTAGARRAKEAAKKQQRSAARAGGKKRRAA